jgi:hypothetical protein
MTIGWSLLILAIAMLCYQVFSLFLTLMVWALIVTLPAIVYIWSSGDYSNATGIAYTVALLHVKTAEDKGRISDQKSSTSRTFSASAMAFTENGFWMKWMPSSRMPWWAMTLAV